MNFTRRENRDNFIGDFVLSTLKKLAIFVFQFPCISFVAIPSNRRQYTVSMQKQSLQKRNQGSISLLSRGLFSGRLGNEERGNKARGSWGKRETKARGGHWPFPSYPARPRFFFNFPIFSLFSPFSHRFSIEGASAEERGLI